MLCWTPGILEEYGNPVPSEFLVAEQDAPAASGLAAQCEHVAESAPSQADDFLTVRCDCETPGYFCSGVPGILAHVEAGKLAPDAEVERCDLCQRYSSDVVARARLVELGIASDTTRRGRYVLYDLDADALASTTIYDNYGDAAEDADQVDDVLVLPFTLNRSRHDKENPE